MSVPSEIGNLSSKQQEVVQFQFNNGYMWYQGCFRWLNYYLLHYIKCILLLLISL